MFSFKILGTTLQSPGPLLVGFYVILSQHWTLWAHFWETWTDSAQFLANFGRIFALG